MTILNYQLNIYNFFYLYKNAYNQIIRINIIMVRCKQNTCNVNNIDIIDKLVKRKFKKNDPWVSGTAIANYMNGEPLLDWLNIYYRDYGFNNNNKKNNNRISKNKSNNKVQKQQITTNPLINNGLKFEKTIYDYLQNKYKTDFVIVTTNTLIDFDKDVKRTKNYITRKIPIIAQAVLMNEKTHIRGVADLLVRSDYINKMFKKPVLKSNEIKHNNKLFYVVIDIKWTSLKLCVDGETLRNEGRFNAYKGQLLIYNYMIGKIQKYMFHKAFIMGKNWKICSSDPSDGYSCFDLLGVIDYSKKDNRFIEQTYKAINWIHDVNKNGLNYSPLKPTIKEMCVNASNNYDDNWKEVKKNILKTTKDITQIWQLTKYHRDIAFDKKIYSWTDDNCTTYNLDMTQTKTSGIIDKILNINRQEKILISPSTSKDIKNNIFNWKRKFRPDFYIDFETISEQIDTLDKINITNSKMNTQIIFMVGIGYEYNNNFHYKCFTLDNLTLKDEKKMLSEFKKYIDELIVDLDPKHKYNPRFFHWSNAEQSMLENAFNRHPSLLKQWENHIEWIDLCDIFRNEPIVVKGALTFKLKDIGKAMYNNGLISTLWDDNDIDDGLDAMTKGMQYYRNKKNNTIIENIRNYNKIDCKIMWDIVRFLRKF